MDANTIGLLGVGLIQLIIAALAWHTKSLAARTLEAAEKTETNTNHMREQLVIATAKASHAEGMREGVKQEKAAEIERKQ